MKKPLFLFLIAVAVGVVSFSLLNRVNRTDTESQAKGAVRQLKEVQEFKKAVETGKRSRFGISVETVIPQTDYLQVKVF